LKNSNNSVINSAENTSEKSNNDQKTDPAVNKQAELPKAKIQAKKSSMANDIVSKNPETVEMLDYSVEINHESKQTNEETSVGSITIIITIFQFIVFSFSFGFYFLFFSHFNTLIVSSHCHSS
jgi:hypothetical protein